MAWTRRGRRGRKVDPEWGQRNRLLRAAKNLTEDELTKMLTAIRAADPTGGLEKCWQAKEKLRSVLSLAGTNPGRSQVWNLLIDFYQHCADADVPQLRRLAWTITIWQPSIIAGINTGISNGKTERYNRIVNSIAATPPQRRLERRQCRIRVQKYRKPRTTN
ncbi:hypothetical protein EH165_03915 [Nakamurella antarctica]|uniref:Transposase IS204/IS1001/IS1096/IS1165 DDE domain-containing protein n=1 Tax=Nakamurella antarctica TaxID=1902245 RepID=A0A3G8ZJI9_9ACTN|nr:transposase [Nakamurella antarctica]AZI57433.1 hypothetical protein EH165_03915 [Nakamurella antarctica]